MKKTLLLVLATILFIPMTSPAQNISDYLILDDIGTYKPDTPVPFFKNRPPVGGPMISQNNSGVLSGTDHFQDHADTTYKVMHIDNSKVKPSPEVEVTQHTGGDSDRWLLHEVENGYRRSKELKATYSAPNPIRIIGNNKIWFQWGAYRWLSNNNVVVSIEFTDLQGTKPEPIEVVQAYLAKFPSTITLTNDEAKGSAHNVQWIKDEMDRRLWLCDKWSMQLQLGKVSQPDMLDALVKNMTIFLNYRQKYYGVSGTDDIKALRNYLDKNDGTSIKAKLTEYKAWWTANKSKSISL